MKRRKTFKLPKEINLQVTQVIPYKAARMDFVSINFRVENYENESFQFLITKAPIEKRRFEIFIHGQLGHPAPEETYSDNSMKKFKKYMEEERIDEIKEKILESIEGNDEFAEQKFDFLLLLS